MKRTLTILLLVLGVMHVMADTNDQLLQKADNFYLKAKFAEAAKIYEKVLSGNKESATVYFNLGNSYYKIGKYPLAILNYERAKLLAPGDEDINYNLSLARVHTQDKIQTVPEIFFMRWWHHLINLKSSNEWGGFSLISFLLFLTALGFFLLTRSVLIKKTSFGFGILFVFLFLFSFGFGLTQRNRLNRHDEAIVFAQTVTIKSSPDNNGNNIFIIHEGLKVKITDQIGYWLEIRLSDGNKGWLPENSVVKI